MPRRIDDVKFTTSITLTHWRHRLLAHHSCTCTGYGGISPHVAVELVQTVVAWPAEFLFFVSSGGCCCSFSLLCLLSSSEITTSSLLVCPPIAVEKQLAYHPSLYFAQWTLRGRRHKLHSPLRRVRGQRLQSRRHVHRNLEIE